MSKIFLRAGVFFLCLATGINTAYSAISDYFVIGDYKLSVDFQVYTYDMKRVAYYNSGVANTPTLNQVLQTESGRFVQNYGGVGLLNYSENLDKLVLTAEPYFTKTTCSTKMFENNQYVGTKDVQYVVPASAYKLELFVGGVKVTSAGFNNYYDPTNQFNPGYNPIVPPIFELPISFRRYVVPYVDSYLRFSIYPKKVNCGAPEESRIVNASIIINNFEIDGNGDTLPDFLEPWYLAERSKHIGVGTAASLLLN